MSKCPYTWFKNLIGSKKSDGKTATELRVTVSRSGEIIVDVALPARSARWLIDVIPDDVVAKIRAEGIPLDLIQKDLAEQVVLQPQDIFLLQEPERAVKVWLE